MVVRTCPICGSSDETKVFAQPNFDLSKLDKFAFASRKLPEYMHYRLIACPTCDLLYANPIPDLQLIAQAYHEAAFDSSEEAHYASRTYGRTLLTVKNRLPDRIGALDIGTGDGAFLEQLLEAGFSAVKGVEPSLAPIQAARPEIRPLIQHAMFEPQDYLPESLSLISCFQTLEHLYDPLAMCQAAHSLLKPGGAVFFVCHNRHALSAKILGQKSPIFDIEHLQLFSPQSAKQLLERTGFEQVQIKVVFNRYPLHYWLRLLPLPKAIKSSFIKFLIKAKIGAIPVTFPAGNLAVTGYKKQGGKNENYL